MNTNYDARGHLERMGIAHRNLSHDEAVTISYTLHGWHIAPRTPPGERPMNALAWLLAALHTQGRYAAPDIPGHPAELEDGAAPVDSVALMAVIQRHFLPTREPAWNDHAVAAQLGIDSAEITRAQGALDRAARLLRYPRPAPLGAHWWDDADLPTASPPLGTVDGRLGR